MIDFPLSLKVKIERETQREKYHLYNVPEKGKKERKKILRPVLKIKRERKVSCIQCIIYSMW